MCVTFHRILLFCFFFKQKTVYEMRISDWSSDVCSSDLVARTIVEFGDGRGRHPVHLGAAGSGWKKCSYSSSVIPAFAGMTRMIGSTLADHLADRQQIGRRSQRAGQIGVIARTTVIEMQLRSEEHTSELQSLMRISYAVFCLQKKKYKSSATKLLDTVYNKNILIKYPQ